VATSLTRETLRRYARLGAMRRLEELRQEEATIRSEFPELFRGGTRRGGPGRASASASTATANDAAAPRRRRRRSTMSAAQRKAVSERMRKYWAARRKAKN
jgi:hypothetical protein